MTKVLVTGVTGNVGSRAVRELRTRGMPVCAFVQDPDKAGMRTAPAKIAVGNRAAVASLEAIADGSFARVAQR